MADKTGKEKYTRGSSGYSVQDENAAKEYGQRDYKLTSGMPASERAYRRDTGGPQNYKHNLKTERGREINAANVKTQDEDAKVQGRPPMSKKWIE